MSTKVRLAVWSAPIILSLLGPARTVAAAGCPAIDGPKCRIALSTGIDMAISRSARRTGRP